MENANLKSGFFSKDKDLKNRIIFTVLMLCVYRLGTYIPLPGIDAQSLQNLMETKQTGLLGMFNVFSGGAVKRMAIFALGIMPYISSSIIIQLLTGVSEYFKNFSNQVKKSVAIINLSKIQEILEKKKILPNSKLNLSTLQKSQLINKKYSKLKLLGSGDIKKKFDIETNFISNSAREKIEKLGGKVILIK